MPPSAAHAFRADLSAVQKTMRASVTELYAKRKDAHWDQWVQFCLSQGFDPRLQSIQDPIPILQVFAKRLHDGNLSRSHKPIRSRTVSDTIRSVGQTLAHLGSKDPRTDSTGSLDFRLTAQFKAYAKLDPTPSRVKPVPITLVMHALHFAYHESPSPSRQAIANMICIAFFFCLRPGEYTGTTTDDQAFHLQDVSFYLDSRIVHHDGPAHELQAATSVTLTFTTQKNGDKGEVVVHARSGDSLCCPVAACARQVLHLRRCCSSSAPFGPSLTLASYFDNGVLTLVCAATVTSSLRVYDQTLYPTTGIAPAAISARSLHADGAMALLQGKCDSNVIKLLARWHSDCMMRYLHQQSLPIFKNLASVMFNNGTYSFLPEEWVPAADPTPAGSSL